MWFYIYIIYNMTWLEYMYCCTKSILPFCTLEFLKSWFLLVSFSIYNERAYKNRLFKESSHWTKFSLSLSFFDLRSFLLNKKRRTWRFDFCGCRNTRCFVCGHVRVVTSKKGCCIFHCSGGLWWVSFYTFLYKYCFWLGK